MEKITPKLLSWASELETSAREQAIRSSRLPFIAGHVALMPDAHWGMGATVGSVIPTQGAVIPAAVGVDIGCGMIAARFDLTAQALPDTLDPLHSLISAAIPAGVGQGHGDSGFVAMMPKAPETFLDSQPQWGSGLGELWDTAEVQFGSLGSGNHFVEVCLDEHDRVWIVLHSGSRGVGNKLASWHIEGAKGLMNQYFIDLEDPDLAYLVEGTPQFKNYITDMLWAQDYAMQSRALMMDLAHQCLNKFMGHEYVRLDQVNCHHNFTQQENHMGKNLWITRKGAIKAASGDRGVIPGSMGARTYVVSGLGNRASYDSCSHGAGRRMSRGEAKRQLTAGSLTKAMKGRAWNAADAEDLVDEHPLAYKDIDQVMADQADLVTIDHTLHQVLNYKGVDKSKRRR